MDSGMYFAVIREPGASWDHARPMREQAGWAEHAAYIDALADAGVVVLVGPLGDGTMLHRALLIFDADSEAIVQARLAEDPWTPAQMLTTALLAPWHVLIGAPAR
jgi:uncharacterized protein YciI